MNPVIVSEEISNLDLPIAKIILEQLEAMSQEDQRDLIGEMTKEDFVSHRADIYLTTYIDSAQSKLYSESGCEEIAKAAALEGIKLH